MTDKPIIFSGPMVRALLDGRKTQTRRVLKPQPDPALPIGGADFVVMPGERGSWCWLNGWDGSIIDRFRVPYAPGDRLYVREALRMGFEAGTPICQATYAADAASLDLTPAGAVAWAERRARNAIPSIHMPRWASRLTLTVTDVRVQRLQEISEEDARAEGAGLYVPGHGFITDSELHADPGYSNFLAPRMGFEAVWWEIHGPDAWAANPWVVALTFTVERRNIDEAQP